MIENRISCRHESQTEVAVRIYRHHSPGYIIIVSKHTINADPHHCLRDWKEIKLIQLYIIPKWHKSEKTKIWKLTLLYTTISTFLHAEFYNIASQLQLKFYWKKTFSSMIKRKAGIGSWFTKIQTDHQPWFWRPIKKK